MYEVYLFSRQGHEPLPGRHNQAQVDDAKLWVPKMKVDGMDGHEWMNE